MTEDVYIEDHDMSNREKVQRPRRTKFWCGGCDCDLVVPSMRCPTCGGKDTDTRRLKKDWN